MLPTGKGDRIFKAPDAKAQAAFAFTEAECTASSKQGPWSHFSHPGVTVVLEMALLGVNFFACRQDLPVLWNSLFSKISDGKSST